MLILKYCLPKKVTFYVDEEASLTARSLETVVETSASKHLPASIITQSGLPATKLDENISLITRITN